MLIVINVMQHYALLVNKDIIMIHNITIANNVH